MLGYALIMFVALTAGAVLLRRSQRELALPAFDRVAIGLGAFCGAMIGAKLPFALYGGATLHNPAVWLADGKTILAGIVGGYAGVEFVKWLLGIRTKTGDTFAVPVALAVGLGRLACFWVGCCFGKPTELPWGVVFPSAGDMLARHPTQLYEAAFHLTLAAVLAELRRRKMFPGQLIKLYILCYLAYRFPTEWLRPEPHLWAGLTAYQWATFPLAAMFAWLWWRDARRCRAVPSPVATSDVRAAVQN